MSIDRSTGYMIGSGVWMEEEESNLTSMVIQDGHMCTILTNTTNFKQGYIPMVMDVHNGTLDECLEVAGNGPST